ncbi:mitochondrial import receptor subunit TOM34 isoform X1 [Selaginella moellendorffii]|uniref:mitochondrial import receptor subunit TOM34 isoform X1 n=1 Tax=Selaginella moellendorffii TaxID=88036 RepID=UPI000D1C4A54|nr:mitochondrial import receptor subunit TOM34 isoform X1 [Selaginella moellendorffii]|eukprot:XP_024525581.1 mitochondrial import receptor subunit TOM34 isoform X1 [Selaginella moellendorffii]
METVESVHQRYRDGQFEKALELYTAMLESTTSLAHKIALYSNRAACYLKLHRFREAAEECGAVLAMDCNHTSVLMLRAQTLIALKEYQSALFDVTRLLEINPKVPAYRELEARLRTQMFPCDEFMIFHEQTLAPIPECEEECPSSPAAEALHSFSPTTVLPNEQHKELEEAEKKKSGCGAVSKPKAHSTIDYSKWNNIGDDDQSDEDEEEAPQYRYRLRTIGLRTAGSSGP